MPVDVKRRPVLLAAVSVALLTALGSIVFGIFTATLAGAAPTPTQTQPLPKLLAPVDLSGTWRISGLFSGTCEAIVQQTGTDVLFVANCDPLLWLTGTIHQTTGAISLTSDLVTLEGTAGADGNSISGTWGTLFNRSGTFTATRASDIDLVDISGDWTVVLVGASDTCALHLDQQLLTTTAHVDCASGPQADLTGFSGPLTNPFTGSFQLEVDSDDGRLQFSGDQRGDGAYLQGQYYFADQQGTFIAVRPEAAAKGILAVDCDRSTAGIQSVCWRWPGNPFDVQLYIALPPDGGYSGYWAQLVAWDPDVLRYTETNNELLDPNCELTASTATADGTPMPKWACIPSPSVALPIHATGLVARAQMTCVGTGDSNLDLAGSAFDAVEPTVVNATVHCDTPPCVPTVSCGGVRGDANCDRAINRIDAALVLQHEAGLLPLSGCLALADINFDDEINAIDATLLLQYAAGLLSSFT